MKNINKKTTFKISSILAMIFSLVGAIMMIATPWAYWWYRYRAGNYIYSGSGVVNIASGPEGFFIFLGALLLFVCFIISLLNVIPEKITSKTPIIISLIIAFVVLIMIVRGAIITATIYGSQNVGWTFGPAFYAGISCTILTILLTLIMLVTKE